MEIKRNIFESSVRMPDRYGSFATPMTQTDLNSAQPSFYAKPDNNVQHAPTPRIGEQK